MRFISPKVDYAFKRIFGSNQSQDILISFLNGIIYEGEKVIQSLTIVNPYNPGQIQTLKDTYLDVRAILQDGSIVLIEIQVARINSFHKQGTYNLCQSYINQLETSKIYPRLNPVIGVTITDFVLFKTAEKMVNHFVFKEKEKSFVDPYGQLELIFVELPKFNKVLSELKTLAEKWIYFIKEATSLATIPDELGEVTEIKRALNIANQANMTLEELEEVDRRAMMLQDETGRITQAQEDGREQGRKEGKISLIMVLINQRFGSVSEVVTSQINSLSLENLESLVKALLNFETVEDLISWLEQVN